MSDQNYVGISDSSKAFLATLQQAVTERGFDAETPKVLDYTAVRRWEAARVQRVHLGIYTLRAWTTWSFLQIEGTICYLHLEIEEETLAVYRCVGIEKFLGNLAFLELIARHAGSLEWLRKVLRCDADPGWRDTQREKLIEQLHARGEPLEIAQEPKKTTVSA